MQMTASAATRRCVARSASVSSSSSAPRRPTSAAAPPASSRRARSSLTVRAFGPGSEIQEGVEVGSRIKVTKPIKVYHVPKKPEIDLLGRTGTVAEVVRFYDGAELSATMPYRVVLDDDEEAKAVAAAGKKPLKVTVHLSGGEIELLA